MSPDFRIVPLDKSMEEDVRHFILDILENEYKYPRRKRPDLEHISKYYQKGHGNFWVAIVEDEVVGAIALSEYSGGRGYVKRFFVKSSLRGKGLGKQLFTTMLQAAKSGGFKALYLGVSEDMNGAVPYYERQGFRRIESLPSDFPRFNDTAFYKLDL